MKKRILIFVSIVISLTTVGCGKINSATNVENNEEISQNTSLASENAVSDSDISPSFINNTVSDSDISITDNTVSDNDMSQSITDNTVSGNETSQADTLLDSFVAGEIEAYYLNSEISFFITELNMNREEWDSYIVGNRVDLDNDGENELILFGPYGGMYLDAWNGKIVVFAQGAGTADLLSYAYYNDKCWIVNSDTTHAGRQFYRFTQYSGSDTIVDSFDLKAEYWDQQEYDENSEFTYRENSISMEEYEAILQNISWGR